MDIKFNWVSQPDPNEQSSVEEELIAAFEDGVIKACHPGNITVSLDITGPLNTTLEGSAQCTCSKVITSFKGDNMGSSIRFT